MRLRPTQYRVETRGVRSRPNVAARARTTQRKVDNARRNLATPLTTFSSHIDPYFFQYYLSMATYTDPYFIQYYLFMAPSLMFE